MSLIRRFSRKIRDSGIIRKVKSKRFNQRHLSKIKIKEGALRRIKNKEQNEKLFKLGKPIKGRRRRR